MGHSGHCSMGANELSGGGGSSTSNMWTPRIYTYYRIIYIVAIELYIAHVLLRAHVQSYHRAREKRSLWLCESYLALLIHNNGYTRVQWLYVYNRGTLDGAGYLDTTIGTLYRVPVYCIVCIL